MLHFVDSRTPAARPAKVSKRAYLNLKSNENLVAARDAPGSPWSQGADWRDLLQYPVYDAAYAALRAHLGVPQVLLTAGCHDAIRVLASRLDRQRNRVVLLMLPTMGRS